MDDLAVIEIQEQSLQVQSTHYFRSNAVEALKAEFRRIFTKANQSAYLSSGIYLPFSSTRRWFTGNMGIFLAPQKVLPNRALNLTLCGSPILGSISFQPKIGPPQSAG